MLVGPVGDGAGSHPRQGQATSCASLTALLKCTGDIDMKGVNDTKLKEDQPGASITQTVCINSV